MSSITRSRLTLILLALVAICCEQSSAGEINVTRRPNAIIISNSVLSRELTFSAQTASGILVTSLALTSPRREMLAGPADVNWFEFSLNNRRVTNRDRAWVFENHTTRDLANGGLELRVRFKGAIEPLRFLRLEILTQMFPRSTICREKIVLSTETGASLVLTAPSQGSRLTFPGYAFRIGGGKDIQSVTIALAGWGRSLIESARISSFDERTLEEGTRVGRNLSQNYMYHPAEINSTLGQSAAESTPGPLFFALDAASRTGILSAYEHGAPDGDNEQEYVFIHRSLRPEGLIVRTEYAKGIFYDRQTITAEHRLESPWNVTGFFDGRSVDNGRKLVWEYLDAGICETAYSRVPQFYYNTWGMQRDEERRGNNVRTILTKERVMEEIESAAKLKVDLFVLDDGWQDRMGDWTPDATRYSNGLRWYVEAVKAKGIIPGLWFATLATDPAAAITAQHPEWLIRDDAGKPIVGRWEMNVFCFDSDYRDYFLKKCKERIDEGVRYFKWDGIDKHLCSSPLHYHGDASIPAGERRAKQGFDIPLLVADAIRRLKEYQPDVVVEVDVTEPNRSVGLAILSEGKYFWMNNGASAYGDYSTHRSKSNRFISNLYHQLIPPSLLTFANYPHNAPPYSSYRANVNSSLTGGRGFWGNLAMLSAADLARVGKVVEKSKAVMKDIAHVRPIITGTIGSSPEIYEWVEKEKGSGQVIAFSGSARTSQYTVRKIHRDRVLAVLNNAYALAGDSLTLHFEFGWPEASREAFILPNQDGKISIVASTSWIDEAERMGDKSLRFVNGAPGTHIIEWSVDQGTPAVTASKEIDQRTMQPGRSGKYKIIIESRSPATEVQITGR